MFSQFLFEHSKYRMIIIFLISFIASWLVFRPLLKIAKKRSLLDNPDERKLQKSPVPVLGGAAVFFGIILGMSFFKTIHAYTSLFPIISAMMIMLYIGTIDDILGINPKVRFLLEILVALLVIFGNRFYISDFQGALGLYKLSFAGGITLSVVAFVGLVNAINMIDGIDGLSSSICIWICGVCGLVFFVAHDFSYAALSVVSIGALLPFFLHNVFGLKTKMFIGDAGTMVMGTVISAMMFEMMRGGFDDRLQSLIGWNFNLVAFGLAAAAIPVFDTLRVMFERIFKGVSPFKPDKTHLHHLFLDLGFSHSSIIIAEIAVSSVIMGIFVLTVVLGGSMTCQLLTVFFTSAIAEWGLSAALKKMARSTGAAKQKIEFRAERSHIERKGFWLKMQKFVDGKDY